MALAGFALLFFLIWWLPQLPQFSAPQKVSTETPQETPKKEDSLKIEKTETKIPPTPKLTEEVTSADHKDPLWFLIKEEFKDLSSWETYKNEEYGFEISYPRSWKIKVEVENFSNSEGKRIRFLYPEMGRDEIYYVDAFGLRISPNKENLSLKQRLEKETPGNTITWQEIVRLGRYDWFLPEYHGDYFGHRTYMMKYGKNIYSLLFNEDYDGLTETKNRDKLIEFIENKILSTIKFI